MSWGDEFWLLVYESRPYFRIFWAFLVFMLLLSSFVFLFGQPGTESRVIAYVNVIMIIGLGVIATAMYWYAARKQNDLRN